MPRRAGVAAAAGDADRGLRFARECEINNFPLFISHITAVVRMYKMHNDVNIDNRFRKTHVAARELMSVDVDICGAFKRRRSNPLQSVLSIVYNIVLKNIPSPI